MNVVRDQKVVATRGFDISAIRADFPILTQDINGHPLAYLDNGASSQKPRHVIDAVQQFYCQDYANVHRGIHTLSERATAAYEESRRKVQRFINARSHQEIIYVRGTTEAINMVAQSYARPQLQPGDTIVITTMEHHSNIVPWKLVCEQTGAQLRVVPINEHGELEIAALESVLNERTRLLALTHISNVLGTINPLKQIIAMAHEAGVPVLVDGAQAAPHSIIDMKALDCDFYAFSGHKMYGPTGIGILYGKENLLDKMPPYQGGGDMILSVSFDKTTYNHLPYKFEAGTPHIAGAIGLGAAVDYLTDIGMDQIARYEHTLLDYGHKQLATVDGLKIIGTAREKASIISFTLDGVHPHDIATVLDQQGIAVRAGHHCAMPLMQHLGLPATTRASFAVYNTREEIDRLVAALAQTKKLFS